MSEDRCVLCGEIIPEGGQVCPACLRMYGGMSARIQDLEKALQRERERAETLQRALEELRT